MSKIISAGKDSFSKVDKTSKGVLITLEKLKELKGTDLDDLCDATEATLIDDSLSFSAGFNVTDPMVRERLENFWKGVLLVPERILLVGRIDGVIAASIQLIKPSPTQRTKSFAGSIDYHFVAPWARGYGLAKQLLKKAESEAKKSHLSILKLSVRANLEAAIKLYQSSNYKCWGTLDKYEMIDNKMIAGHFYYKEL